MEKKHKAIVDYIPHIFQHENYVEIASRIDKLKGTITRSLDDLKTLLNGGNDESYVRVWPGSFLPVDHRKRIEEIGYRVEYWHLESRTTYPSVVSLKDDLPVGTNLYRIRKVEDIHFLTIHHSVGWGSEDNETNINTIASYHVNGKGWPGIGYHYVICPDGQIYSTNDHYRVSYHAGTLNAPGDENWVSLGICFGGDFRKSMPTKAAQQAGRALVTWLQYNLPGQIAVVPHKRMPGAQTACPGEYRLEEWLKFVSMGKS